MTVNNHPISKQIRRKLGYVLQQNVFLENLTVKETFQVEQSPQAWASKSFLLFMAHKDEFQALYHFLLQFAVQLWSPESVLNGQLKAKISEVVEKFNLQKCMNSSRFDVTILADVQLNSGVWNRSGPDWVWAFAGKLHGKTDWFCLTNVLEQKAFHWVCEVQRWGIDLPILSFWSSRGYVFVWRREEASEHCVWAAGWPCNTHGWRKLPARVSLLQLTTKGCVMKQSSHTHALSYVEYKVRRKRCETYTACSVLEGKKGKVTLHQRQKSQTRLSVLSSALHRNLHRGWTLLTPSNWCRLSRTSQLRTTRRSWRRSTNRRVTCSICSRRSFSLLMDR